MCVLFCHIFTMIFVEFQSLITKFLKNSNNGYLFLHWLTDLHIHFLSIWILSNISGEKKECMCLFSCWYVDFLLLSLKRASLENICVALGVDLLKTSPARVKISLVVAQNGHWFVDFLWMSLVEKYMCGFWCWRAQNESSEGQNCTSVWCNTVVDLLISTERAL